MVTAHQMFQMLVEGFSALFTMIYMVQNAGVMTVIIRKLWVLRLVKNIRTNGGNIGIAIKH